MKFRTEKNLFIATGFEPIKLGCQFEQLKYYFNVTISGTLLSEPIIKLEAL